LLFWDVTPSFTVEQLVFLITQVLRILAFAFLAIVIPYTYNPSQYGITFRGLGIGDKFAYAMDLSFRLVPSTARDFTIILDAQRARGYEVDKLRGGIVAKIRRLAPLVIPLVIGAIINGEEIADAMDLRAFGIQKRTWLPELIYTNADRILIGVSFFLLALAFIARVAWDAHMVWVPPFLLEVALG
jgi:energy-coupling factor transport system permease protein